MDYVKGKHRGFGFVEYEDADDASEAIFNLDGGEILGRTLQVNLAQANQMHNLTAAQASTEAIWKSDEWFQKYVGSQDDPEQLEAQETKKADTATLKGA
jgi:peptidyl-prolyl isomerase E (cyclophilin E)